MNLWVSALLLAVGLILSSWALTEEECKPLVEPQSMANHSEIFARWNFIAGYNDNELLNSMLKMTQSYRFNITEPKPSSPNEFGMIMENRINGSCLGVKSILTVDGFTAHSHMLNITCRIQSLPTCDDCLLFNINGTTNQPKDVLEKMHLDLTPVHQEISYQAFYLMAKRTEVDGSDLEHFKKQAECLGFSGEPGFLYDPKNRFCEEDELVTISTH